jgi:hypothetical protein
MNDATMLRKWGSVLLGATLCFLIGLNVGAEGIRRKAHETDSAVSDAKTKLEEAAKTLAEAKTQVERFKAAYIDAIGRVAECAGQSAPAPAGPFAPLRVTQ